METTDGTSSTPPAAEAAPVASADQTPTSTTTPTIPAETAPVAETTMEPAATQEATPIEPTFTVPDDLKISPEAHASFTAFLKEKMQADGKLSLTSQEVLDQYVAQARDAQARWQKQIQDTDKANEAVCKQRFTPAQLAASETAVGFFSSFDPAFRDFAKRQLNDPVFVNAMRTVGERLSEDTFEIGGTPPAPVGRKSAAERMGYTRKTN
jgi:hypothetical protein